MQIIFRNVKTNQELIMPVTPPGFTVAEGRSVETLDMAETGQVNLPVLLGPVEHGQRDGTGDVYVTLELRQFRELLEESTEVNPDTGNLSRAAPQEKKEEGSYTVVKGDTLWGICRRTYGDGALAWKLAEFNGIKNANLIYPGQVVRLPDRESL